MSPISNVLIYTETDRKREMTHAIFSNRMNRSMQRTGQFYKNKKTYQGYGLVGNDMNRQIAQNNRINASMNKIDEMKKEDTWRMIKAIGVAIIVVLIIGYCIHQIDFRSLWTAVDRLG